MKHFNKKIVVLLFIVGLPVVAFNQSTNGLVTNNNYNATWFLGWNNTNGANPLFFRTNAINRMKLNGNVNYTINGYAGTRNGNMLLGFSNNSMADGQNIYTQKGAFSLLHINGSGSSYQEYGYHPWTKTGVTFTGTSCDLSITDCGGLNEV